MKGEKIQINTARQHGKASAVEDWQRRHEKVQEAVEPYGGSVDDLTKAMIELSRGAINDSEVMKTWNETFPGVCPGCFKPHVQMMPLISKGLCTMCNLKVSKAKKQLAPQE